MEKLATWTLIGLLFLLFSFLCASVESELGHIFDYPAAAPSASQYLRVRSSYDYELDPDPDPGGPGDDLTLTFAHESQSHHRVKRETIRFENDVVVIPENYSIHEPPPTLNGVPTKVDFYILIIDIRDINEVQEEMTLEMNLQIYWQDARLSHWALPTRKTNSKFGVLNPQLIKDIWHPDVFIDHVKKIDQPRVISVPASLRFYYNDSSFRYSGRYTMKIGCQMVFQLYPADTQRCGIEVKSYSYSASTLVLTWRDGKPPAIKRGLTLPNFALALGKQEEFWLNTSSSAYSGIKFAVVLRRHLGFHLIQTYLLSCLFVILSFLTFLVAHESVLECMALCMTTLLTLTAMFAAVKQNTPTVSYVKGLDIWMVTCIFSVFFTLVEHTILLRLRSMRPYKQRSHQIITARDKSRMRKARRSIFSICGRKNHAKANATSNGSVRRLGLSLGLGLGQQEAEELAMAYHKCSSKCKQQRSSGSSGENSPVLELKRGTAERTSSYTTALWANDFISPLPTLSPSITPTLSPVRTSSFRVSSSMSQSLLLDEGHRHRSQSHHALSNGRVPVSRSISGFHSESGHPFISRTSTAANKPPVPARSRQCHCCPNLRRRFYESTNVKIFFSKLLIPICFIIFNCIYWPWLLLTADFYDDTEFKNTKYT